MGTGQRFKYSKLVRPAGPNELFYGFLKDVFRLDTTLTKFLINVYQKDHFCSITANIMIVNPSKKYVFRQHAASIYGFVR